MFEAKNTKTKTPAKFNFQTPTTSKDIKKATDKKVCQTLPSKLYNLREIERMSLKFQIKV